MPQQTSYKVLLIGDNCIDKYVYGDVKKLNPEAPVPVLNLNRVEIRKGMCWNVFNNLDALGIEVDMVTHEEEIVKTRYIDEKSNQQILRLDEEPSIKSLCCDDIPNEKYDAIVISDYNKGFVSFESLCSIVYSAKCPVFIDSKKQNLPKNNCFIKINELEYQNLKEKYDNIIVTLGKNGAKYKNKTYKTKKIETRDIIGAGDTFLSALVYGYLKNGTIESAIRIANLAAGIAVSHSGTYVLTEEDVKNLCH
jgi:D-beta-D-heptose 7-phosphate kinase/D-beta-D-heptose 1-phosphate adenosyltransferase